MKTTVVNFKVDPKVKVKAQARAKKMGISLSAILNMSLVDFAEGSHVEFPARRMTPHMEKLIEESLASGTVGPFETIDDAIDYLRDRMKQNGD
jgi:antitoxin component of RelBE/YafQ-DinJ toxin-antitoxin module